ncbi:hypothetical protein JOD54_000503 [Actinokineospora baliensis]|uniref:hypothetical protein n=1 Tax=Actinokineospora baliensis TaxID=547056 RepID=UPI00195AE861|nr:hypothetical protein [Actinokineospora baliensis]MBM7770299.1 hypothetical protein [Actinokineospora baliensis]
MVGEQPGANNNEVTAVGGDSVQIGHNIGDVHVVAPGGCGKRVNGPVFAAAAVVALSLTVVALVVQPLARAAENRQFTVFFGTSEPRRPDPSPAADTRAAQVDADPAPCGDNGEQVRDEAQSACAAKSARQKHKDEPKVGQPDRRCLPR